MVTENPFERELPEKGGYQPKNTVDTNNPPRQGKIVYETVAGQPKSWVGPLPTERSNKQVILGSPPSKSNCYIIITLKAKEGGKSQWIAC